MSAPRIPVRGGKPKHIKQLNTGSPTAGWDCGPCSELVGLESVSRNAFRPNRDRQRLWISRIRRPMTRGFGWPATTLINIVESTTSARIRQLINRLSGNKPTAKVRTLSHDQVIEQLRLGHAVLVGIDYGRLNRLMPRLSGARTFNQGHAITLRGLAMRNGVAWTNLYDPLHDGRRSDVPKGIQRVRVRRYLRVAESFGLPPAGRSNARVVVFGKE